MSVVLDTNILTRAAQPAHPLHHQALEALAALKQRGEDLCIVPQNLYEFWVVATRPVAANGLAMSIAQADAELSSVKRLFSFLNDTQAVYAEWEKLVLRYAVAGKGAHDARIVAAMTVHGVMQILTFNTADFNRFSDIVVLNPLSVANQSSST